MIDLMPALALALIPGFLLLDFMVQHRRYEQPRHWRLHGARVTTAIFFWSGEVTLFWSGLFGDQHLFNSSAPGTGGGALLGIMNSFTTGTPCGACVEPAVACRPPAASQCRKPGAVPAAGTERGGRPAGRPVPDLQRDVPACQPRHAIWAGLYHPAPGKPQHPSCTRRAPVRLPGSAALGHGVRYVPASVQAASRRLRLLSGRIRPAHGDVAGPGRDIAAHAEDSGGNASGTDDAVLLPP